jgi:sugar phosphate permease
MGESGTSKMQRTESAGFFYGWVIVGIVFFVSLIDGGFTYIFSAFLKPLAQEFGWSRAETAGAFSLYLLASGFVLPLWGWLADHHGVRVVFLLSALIDGIALFLLSYVDSLFIYYVLYFFLGVGLGGIGPMSVGKIISLWFVEKRGRAVAIALIGAGAGGLVLVPLTGFLIETFNWRVAYQGLGVLALGGMFPLVWFFLSDKPEERGLVPLGQDSHTTNSTDTQKEHGPELEGWTLKEALYSPAFWLLGVAFCLGLMAALAVIAHQVAFLQDTGLTLEGASTIAGIALGVSMGGRFVTGWVSERARHLHPVIALCLAVQAVGVGLLLCLDFLGFGGVILFALLFGSGYGGLVVLWPLTISHDFGLRAFGAIAGTLGTVAASFGGAVGPVLVGALYDHTGDYFWGFLACAVMLALGAGVALVTPTPTTAQGVVAPGYATERGWEKWLS